MLEQNTLKLIFIVFVIKSYKVNFLSNLSLQRTVEQLTWVRQKKREEGEKDGETQRKYEGRISEKKGIGSILFLHGSVETEAIYIYTVVPSKTFSCFPFISRGYNRNIKCTVLTYMDL